MLRKKEIEKVLKKILDPELGISLWDLGLIYDIIVKKNNIKIVMTLTTMGCPLFGVMKKEIIKEVKKLEGVGKIEVELTFDPPWGPEKMSEKTREELGL